MAGDKLHELMRKEDMTLYEATKKASERKEVQKRKKIANMRPEE